MLSDRQRERFDRLLEGVLEGLPPDLHALLDEVPLIVEDEPDVQLLDNLAREWAEEPMNPDELCGLHTGTAFTERSLENLDLPSGVYLFRRGIIAEAGGWKDEHAEDHVREQIRITLLHEIGHQFGLGEDDLGRLGYE